MDNFSSNSKLKVLSDISRDVAQVFFASVFLAPLLSSEPTNSFLVASGLIVSVVLWGASLLAVK